MNYNLEEWGPSGTQGGGCFPGGSGLGRASCPLLLHLLPQPSEVMNISHIYYLAYYLGFPWWLSGKQSACNAGDARNTVLIPRLGRTLEKEMATHSSI